MEDKIITLKNGLNVGLLEFGDLNSNNILFYLHGFPGCRFEPLFIKNYAIKNKIKVISIDRIGYGNSSFYKELTIKNFADIFKELLNELNIDSFNILAVSGGSPYFAGVLNKLQDRVKKAILVSGLAPINNSKVLNSLKGANKFFLKLGLRFPTIASFFVKIIASFWRFSPKIMILWCKFFMSKSDIKLLNLKDNNKYIKNVFYEATKNGINGIMKDFELYLKDWDINFSNIMTKVDIFHGDDDPYVSYEMGKYLHTLYQNSTFTTLNGGGHLAIIQNVDLIMVSLKE